MGTRGPDDSRANRGALAGAGTFPGNASVNDSRPGSRCGRCGADRIWGVGHVGREMLIPYSTITVIIT